MREKRYMKERDKRERGDKRVKARVVKSVRGIQVEKDDQRADDSIVSILQYSIL